MQSCFPVVREGKLYKVRVDKGLKEMEGRLFFIKANSLYLFFLLTSVIRNALWNECCTYCFCSDCFM